MTARYLLCPGVVRSRTDGDRHFVGTHELAMLYGVRMDECLALPEGTGFAEQRRRDDLLARADLIRLTPRGDGNYTRPAQ